VSEYPVRTRTIRYLYVIALTIIIALFPDSSSKIRTNLHKIKTSTKSIILLFLVTVFFSSILHISDIPNTLFGDSPDYLGVLTWFVFVYLGIMYSSVLKKILYSTYTYAFLLAAVIVSLVTDRYYILTGVRVSGAMLQATTMGVFASMVTILGVYHFVEQNLPKHKTLYATCIALSVACVLLSQSRIGILVTAISLFVLAVYCIGWKSILAAAFITSQLIILAIMPFVAPNYFERLHESSVHRGISYRYGLYNTSIKELAKAPHILGQGPNALPDAINNRGAVPEDIARSLKLGVVFGSSHNLYIDVYYKFGVVAMLCLGYLTVIAFKNYLRASLKLNLKDIILLLILLILTSDALFNVPSIEITSLLFIVIFAGFSRRSLYRNNHEYALGNK
jgi:O-antigen ligase